MRLLDHRTLRRVLPPCFAGALLALGAVCFAPPAPLLGQGVEECEADPELCPPPVVTLVPAGGAWSGAEDSTVVTVTVEACGQVAFRSGFEVTVNGDPVPFPFSTGGRAPGCMSTARGARAIGVGTGGAGVVARACNVFGRCGEAVATYGYTKVVPGVEVAPDGGRSVSAPGAAGTYAFTVRNPGSHAADYTLEARCSGAASGCAAPATVRVAAGASASVSVAFQAGGEARRGRVTLAATQANAPAARDSGWVEVVTTGGAPGALGVDAASVSPGTTLDREGCVVAAAGADAAYVCGDLRIAHMLPAIRTLDRPRAPVLLHDSRHADPWGVVAALVTRPAVRSAPDSVVAELFVGAGTAPRARRRWAGSEWEPESTRRIALAYPAAGDTTGVYAYRLRVVAHHGTTASAAPEATGERVGVNRRGSPFGAGWWLAGLERLHFLPGGSLLWVGGDGSARRYAPAGANAWAVTPAYDRPDTLRYLDDDGDGRAEYVRLLPGRVRVRFDAAGRHVATASRLGHTTRFFHRAAGEGLDSIQVPTGPGRWITSHRFLHDSTAAGVRLSVVSSPAPAAGGAARTVVLTRAPDASGRVTALRDPDGTAVGLGYDGHRVGSRTDRRGTVTSFAYGDGGGLVQARIALQGTGADVTVGFSSAETLGLAGPVDTARAYTRLSGPRAAGDTTLLWLDRFGAPRRVRDALGGETHLARGDARFPALVTRLRAPNGRVTAAAYTARGALASVTDSSTFAGGRYATTRYVYGDPLWPDFATRVVPPEGDSVVVGYDPATGNRAWREDARGPSTRVLFRYYAAGDARGRLRAVDGPLTDPASVAYDAALGNLAESTSAGITTRYARDDAGRIVSTTSPGDGTRALVERVFHDAMDRDTLAVTGDTAVQSVWVKKGYDAEGNLVRLTRRVLPDSAAIGAMTTTWAYDRAGRRTAETAPDGFADSTAYDPAGNAVRVRTRRGHVVTMEYDLLDRLVTRRLPSVAYPRVVRGARSFPAYGDAAGLVLPAETHTFAYDAGGNLRSADNPHARVRRVFHPNGTLLADTLHLARWDGVFDPGLHVYGLRHGYDLNGRRVWTKHPRDIAPRRYGSDLPLDSAAWRYGPAGLLASMRDAAGSELRFFHDAEGRLDSLFNVTGGVGERRRYDAHGRLVHRLERGAFPREALDREPSALIHQDSLAYDARGKVERAVLWPNVAQVSLRYSLLGAVVESADEDLHRDGDPVLRERWTGDGTGNSYRYLPESSLDWRRYHYQPGTGRLLGYTVAGAPGVFRDTAWYDRAGNREYAAWSVGSTTFEAMSYHGADERLRAVDRRACTQDASLACVPPRSVEGPASGVWEEYRYDALGRRVMVRARRGSYCTSESCHSTLDRVVWDGDQILHEIRVPGGDTIPAAALERDTATIVGAANAPYGRVAYAYGPLGIDRPLSVIRMGYTVSQRQRDAYPGYRARMDSLQGAQVVFPHESWRGLFDDGTFDNQLDRKCVDIFVAGTGPAMDDQVCVDVDWPAQNTNTQLQTRALGEARSWMGSVVTQMRDASGQLYRRNRYYDPATGRFTQEDPIGFAGGINLYAFGGGDPVSYSDPYGLAAEARCPPICNDSNPRHAELEAEYASNASNEERAFAAGLLGAMLGAPFLSRVGSAILSRMGLGVTRAAPAAGAAGQALFRDGERVQRFFETAQGRVEMLYRVNIQGSTLHLDRISIMPQFAERLSLGSPVVQQGLRTLVSEARTQGFETLRLTGGRISGANSGRIQDLVISLQR